MTIFLVGGKAVDATDTVETAVLAYRNNDKFSQVHAHLTGFPFEVPGYTTAF